MVMINNLQKRGEMTLEDIRNKAPSVFATEPYQGVSEKYKFIPTATVIEKMIENGFVPVMASECRTRQGSGKAGFTKHIMRFRHSDFSTEIVKGEEIPELVLTNSHDRTSGYVLEAGIFRTVCSNGLVVCSESFSKLSVRHMGRTSLVDDILEGSFKIIENLPVVMEKVEQWKAISLNADQQVEFAKGAIAFSKNSLEIEPIRLLDANRAADHQETNGSRSLYKTFNVIQENLVRGGLLGKSDNGKFRHSKAINSITADTQLNRELWNHTETFQKLVALSA